MIRAYVGTYTRTDLAAGAAASLERNIIGGVDLFIIAMTGCNAPIGDYRVVATPVPRWMGHTMARALSDGKPFIYIDDDVRLIAKVDPAERYGTDALVMPSAGFMVCYEAGTHNMITNRLPVMRGGGQIAWEPLRQAAEDSQCELIDDIWLHIDKGHEDETEARRRVIDLVDGEQPAVAVAAIGPGSQLKAMLASFGITVTPDCPCADRARQMDAWGPDECERRTDEIVGWLREEAERRGLPFLDLAGRMLVNRAIAAARAAG